MAAIPALRGYSTRHAEQIRLVRSRPALAWLALVSAFLVLFPLFANSYVTTIAVGVLMTFVGAIALNLLMERLAWSRLGRPRFSP